MKTISLKLKKLGKRKINTITININEPIKKLEDLLSACVKSEVRQYNELRTNTNLISFLSNSSINDQAESGKVGFGELNNTQLANLDKSLKIVLQGFVDGLFVVFINDEEIKSLDQKINLDDTSSITFLRLSFLTGTFW